ncbi:MAG TPA: hypothetical protein DD740_12580 [Chryseobacterium sp.]|nr:hypothetical protein [Chryseobacterium sp.]
MEQQVSSFETRVQPAVRYIFFVIANNVKQSVELVNNRNNKKGCRYHRGYVEVLSSNQRKKTKNPKDSISVAVGKTDGTSEKEMNYEQFRTII